MAIGDIVMSKDEQVMGSLAEAYVSIRNEAGEKERFLLFNLIDFVSTIKINTKTKGIIGRANKVTYPVSWEGTWKATIVYNSPIFRDLLYKFKSTGYFPDIEIQTTNENVQGTIGRQTVNHKGCLIDSAILSKIDSNADDELTEDISGTFNDFEIPERFREMDGMRQ